MNLTSAQQLAVTAIDNSVLVAAGAGSGKTRVLVERIIENLERSPDLKVSNLMAVTFTRKAAEEMRVRLKLRVKELADASEGDRRQRWQRALREIDSAHIGTIHSLCQAILRSFPVECKVDPQFEAFEDEDPKQAEILKAAIEQAFRELLVKSDSQSSVLLSYPFEEIEDWLSQVMKSPLQFDEALAAFGELSKSEFHTQVEVRLMHSQRRLSTDLLANPEWLSLTDSLATFELADSTNKLELLRKEVVERISRTSEVGSEPPEIWTHLLFIANITLREGGRSSEAGALREHLKSLRDLVRRSIHDLPLSAQEVETRDWELLDALVALSRRARTLYEQEKSLIQKQDFNDLIRRTYDAVAQPGSRIRQSHHASLKEILIDEFQDTNRMQAQLLALLAGPETRLFLIGDDKQSIYKFQGADVSTFNEWHAYFANPEMEATQGGISVSGDRQLLGFGESFRSHPKIVNFVNAIFVRLLSDDNSIAKYRATHRPLLPSRQCIGTEERVEVIGFETTDELTQTPGGRTQEIEPEVVANWIVDKIAEKSLVTDNDGKQRPIELGDFAILVQRNDDFAALESALGARGIPYVTVGGKTFLERQEVYDLENLLKFLSNPDDSHALLGVLRSPIFALPDDLLHDLATQNQGSLWVALNRAKERPAGSQLISRAVLLLKRLLAEVPVKTLDELVRSIITNCCYDLILLAVPDGRQRSRNLWKLADIAARNNHMSLGEFTRHLQNMRTLKVKQSNAPLETSNAVKLMTVHRAKGLEFPAVLLPVLRTTFRRTSGRLIFHHQYGVAVNTQRAKNDPKPLSYRLGSLMDEDMEIAEKKRLLYVAMTRARDYLAIFIGDSERRNQSFAAWLEELLDMDPDQGSETGLKRSIQGHAATFLFKRLAGRSKRMTKTDAIADSEPARGEWHTDLLEPLSSQLVDPPSTWHGWSRITPQGSGAKLDPVVFGEFFHLLMEYMPSDLAPLSDHAIEALAFSFADFAVHKTVRQALVAEGKNLLKKLETSELWTLMKNATKVLHEFPYYKWTDGDMTVGRPDLLIQQNQASWLLVDYKTDRFPVEKIEQQARIHYPQLKRYQEDLAQLAGMQADTAIYFAQHGLLYRFAASNAQ